jgi:hemolysin III
MTATTPTLDHAMPARPRLRGVSHGLAFLVAAPLAVAFALLPDTPEGRAAAITYGAAVAFMFGASGAYHRFAWASLRWRPLARRVDHAGVYLLIAGSYTPVGLLILEGSARLAVLGVVWIGATAAILVKICWLDAPKWLAASLGIALGWVGVFVLPEVWDSIGLAGCALLVAGGIAYTLGGVVYAAERPDPAPAVFGYHEVFHVLVIVAVALQYAAIAFYVLPSH